MTQEENMDEMRLHSYVDGELDATARAETEAWLGGHPEAAARVHAYRAQKDALHALYDGVLEAPLPGAMIAVLSSTTSPITSSITSSTTSPIKVDLASRPWMRIAAALALIILGGAVGWFGRGYSQAGPAVETAFVGQAVGAHAVYVAEVRHPVEVGAGQEKHLVAWLSKRLGKALRAPDMSAAGFSLIGGRLLPDRGKPAAQFMYEDKEGRRVTLYVRAGGARDTAFKFIHADGASAFYWIDDAFGYALIGDIPRDRLLHLARIAYGVL